MSRFKRILQLLLTVGAGLLLSGCEHLELLNPQGTIARSEMYLLVEATLLMLIIVIPVMILVVVMAWRYRSNNKAAEYKPNWGHSNAIELICWSVPIVLIIILGIMTWVSTHALDPYKPLKMKGKNTLVIQVVSLDWRWLFIYPDQRIAATNFMEIPVNTPVELQITSDAPMNSLEMPQLAGQIFAMGGMRTKLNFNATKPGLYKGLSTNYSGDGFAGMTFHIKAVSQQEFDQWVQKTQLSPTHLTLQDYTKLAQPSFNTKPIFFSNVADNLFRDVIWKFTKPNSPLVTKRSAIE